MVNRRPELPRFSKPIRAAAIIETAHGVLLVQDVKDHFRNETNRILVEKFNNSIRRGDEVGRDRYRAAMRIVANGRFSLPGGKIERVDYLTAGAEDLFNLERPLNSKEEIELFREVVREAAIREVTEELGAKVDFEQVPGILEIQGRTRNHVICVLRIHGNLDMRHPEEISGIGFLNEDNVIPFNSYFYQAHLHKLMGKYIRADVRRRQVIPRYLSHIRVPKSYMDHWQANQEAGYENRSEKYRKSHPHPTYPESSPTFVILDEDNEVLNPYQPASITDSARAKIFPSSKNPEENRKKSAPQDEVDSDDDVERH